MCQHARQRDREGKCPEHDDGARAPIPGHLAEQFHHLAAARPVAGLVRRASGLGEGLPYFIAVVMLTTFVFGIAYAFITVPSMTLVQEELPELIRGRVFGVLNMLVSVFSLAPLVIVGPIADLWGVAPVFIGSAALVGIVWYAGRGIRQGPEVAPS